VFHLLAVLSLLFLGLAAYSNSLSGPFLFDDHHSIRNNQAVHWTHLSWSGVQRVVRESHSRGRPLANLSFALNYYFGQQDVRGYHAVNVAIHLLSSLLVYLVALATLQLVARREDQRSRPTVAHWIALGAALIFVSHPVQTQAVTYTVQRMTSLCTLFYLTAFVLYIYGRVAQTSRRRWTLWAAGLACWILALGSKQISATLPLIVIVYEWFFFQDMSPRWIKRNAKYSLLALVPLCLVAWIYLDLMPWESLTKGYAQKDFSLGERLLTQSRVVMFYLSLLVCPHPSRLNVMHHIATSQSLLQPITTLISMASIFGLMGLAVYLARRQRLASFCILWFFINLVIESSILPLAMLFEHRLYLPMVGVALLVSWLLFAALENRPQWAVGIVVAASLLLATGTYQRNHTWKDAVTLWADVVDKNPLESRAQFNLGLALQHRKRNGKAIQHYRESARLDPNDSEVHINWGVILEGQEHFGEAVTHYREALRIKPDYYPALNNLAWVLATCPDASFRDGDRAVELAKRAAEMAGLEDAALLDTLAAAHAEAGQFREAVRWQQKAVELAPQQQKNSLRQRLELYNSGKPFHNASGEGNPVSGK
jgi:tetratricopeptide (TPR) repeat protein